MIIIIMKEHLILDAYVHSSGSHKLYQKYNDNVIQPCYSVNEKTGRQVRKGKAMMQIHTMNMNRPHDRRDIIMPSADRVERSIMNCLLRAGLSGCLGSGASMCT